MTEPTRTGSHGRAWQINLADCVVKNGIDPKDDTGIAAYVIEAKWAHPVWHNYWFAGIHLRDTKGVKAEIRLDKATHQIWIWAIDPDASIQDILDAKARNFLLTPVNFSAQLICTSDDAFLKTMEFTVDEIIQGTLDPDTDGMGQWIARFGDNLLIKPAPLLWQNP